MVFKAKNILIICVFYLILTDVDAQSVHIPSNITRCVSSGGDTMVVGGFGLYLSVDGGKTFTPLPLPDEHLFPEPNVSGVLELTKDCKYLFIGGGSSYGGLYRYSFPDSSYDVVTPILNSNVVSDVCLIENRLYVSFGSYSNNPIYSEGIFFSDDFGESWNALPAPNFPDTVWPSIVGLEVSTQGKLLAWTPQSMSYAKSGAFILYDLGNAWTSASSFGRRTYFSDSHVFYFLGNTVVRADAQGNRLSTTIVPDTLAISSANAVVGNGLSILTVSRLDNVAYLLLLDSTDGISFEAIWKPYSASIPETFVPYKYRDRTWYVISGPYNNVVTDQMLRSAFVVRLSPERVRVSGIVQCSDFALLLSAGRGWYRVLGDGRFEIVEELGIGPFDVPRLATLYRDHVRLTSYSSILGVYFNRVDTIFSTSWITDSSIAGFSIGAQAGIGKDSTAMVDVEGYALYCWSEAMDGPEKQDSLGWPWYLRDLDTVKLRLYTILSVGKRLFGWFAPKQHTDSNQELVGLYEYHEGRWDKVDLGLFGKHVELQTIKSYLGYCLVSSVERGSGNRAGEQIVLLFEANTNLWSSPDINKEESLLLTGKELIDSGVVSWYTASGAWNIQLASGEVIYMEDPNDIVTGLASVGNKLLVNKKFAGLMLVPKPYATTSVNSKFVNEQIEGLESVIVSPNPSHGLLRIRWRSSLIQSDFSYVVTVTDFLGRIALRESGFSGRSYEYCDTSLDMSGYNAGIYYVSISMADSTQTCIFSLVR